MRAVSVKERFDLPPYEKEGDIGIEIEMEGNVILPHPDLCSKTHAYWGAKPDHSMKGPGLEYYLWHPIPRNEVKPAIKYLKKFWKDAGCKLKPTNCDAVHVHMNCRELSLDKTMSFILLLVLLEDLLVRWCGESREGNLFCLRTRDAEGLLSVLRTALIKKDFGSLYYEHLKYAAINIAPLASFGSVEIRCMQTPKDIDLVTKWVEMLCCIYDTAIKLENIRDVVDVLSYRHYDELLLSIFGEYAEEFLFPDADRLLADGRERVKEVVYSAHIYKERKKNKTLIAPPTSKAKKKITPIDYNWTEGSTVNLAQAPQPSVNWQDLYNSLLSTQGQTSNESISVSTEGDGGEEL